jgi:hypothetical protein
MSHTSRAVLLCLVGAVLVLGGCVPNSFRILKSADNIHDPILLPPGAVISQNKLDLHVETQTLETRTWRCQYALPSLTSDPITLSNPYWHAAGSRVIRIEIEVEGYAERLTLLPPSACLNRAVRSQPAGSACPQDYIVDKFLSTIENDADWRKCVARDARTQLIADVSEVLPHRASESGALREERTYAHPPEGVRAEVIRLLPGAVVCVSRDHTLVYTNEKAWSSSQACSRLLEAPDASGRVVLSRTDNEDMFPLARDFYGTNQDKIYEAHSWLAVRGMLAALMPRGAFLYVYYSGQHSVPSAGEWEANPSNSRRMYRRGGDPGRPIPLTPILVAQSQPLKLTGSEVPDLNTLCKGSGDFERKVCFAFSDFATIDVMRPYSVNGLVQYAPSGTLTTDVPEIKLSWPHVATRVFRGRRVLIDFDVTKAGNAIPLAADDQFGGRP